LVFIGETGFINGIGTEVFSVTEDIGAGPYSLQNHLQFNALGPGNTNLTTDILAGTAVVPEPSSLTLLGTAFLGLGWFARRKTVRVRPALH
jgi:hypothetical protein